jgi:chain length determinant protein tyrosine kinase EpsG
MNMKEPYASELADRTEPHADFLIGTLLIKDGRLTPESRDHILHFQKDHDLLFCEAGIDLGLLKRDDVRDALAQQLRRAGIPAKKQNPVAPQVLAVHSPMHPCTEAIRTLRSQLMLRWRGDESRGKCLAVVGVEAGVGRSFIAANLATLFSQLGQRTLLIDANLRAPSQHIFFSLDEWPGLSSVLADQTDQGAIVHLSAVNRLSVLPAGPHTGNPQELLSSQKFKTVLDKAVLDYDVVLIDTPAWTNGADAQIIAARAGSALLVTRPVHTPARHTVAFIDELRETGTCVVGAVMNQA